MKPIIVLGLATLFAGPALAQQQQQQLPAPPSGQTLAQAEFVGTQGQALGTAALVETPQGVLIQVRMTGLPAGVHGFHIHSVGRCDPPGFQSAEGHFNPTDAQHGFMNPQGAHAGDLPNVFVQDNGVLDLDVLAAEVSLGTGPNSLFREGGTALVLHAGPDDYASDPAGQSGDRIACGVITRQTQP